MFCRAHPEGASGASPHTGLDTTGSQTTNGFNRMR